MYVHSFVQRICPLTFGTIALLFGQRIYPLTFAPTALSAHVCAFAYLLSPPIARLLMQLQGSNSLPAIFPFAVLVRFPLVFSMGRVNRYWLRWLRWEGLEEELRMQQQQETTSFEATAEAEILTKSHGQTSASVYGSVRTTVIYRLLQASELI